MVQDNAAANMARGQKQQIGDGDLTEATLASDRWVPIFEVQSSKSIKYFPGYGTGNRQGQAGYSDLDLEADGSGTGTDGDSIAAELRWEVYNDAAKDDLAAVGPYFRSEDLRAAVSQDRTEKVLSPMQRVGAPEDGYLVLAAKVDSAQDGVVVEADTSAHSGSVSDVGMAYTKIRA